MVVRQSLVIGAWLHVKAFVRDTGDLPSLSSEIQLACHPCRGRSLHRVTCMLRHDFDLIKSSCAASSGTATPSSLSRARRRGRRHSSSKWATSGFEMCFASDPSTKGAGGKIRLKASLKKFKPPVIYDCFFRWAEFIVRKSSSKVMWMLKLQTPCMTQLFKNAVRDSPECIIVTCFP